MNTIDLTSKRFGRLTAQWPSGKRCARGASIMWLCLCDCGNLHLVDSVHLRNGKTLSCGCLRRTAPQVSSTFRHGHALRGRITPEYKCWCHIIERCTNPNYPEWRYYGGRGIKVCKRWMRFENFLEDMGPRPSCPTPHAFSIDRYPDNDGNYEPGNCRWATPVEQNANRRGTAPVSVL